MKLETKDGKVIDVTFRSFFKGYFLSWLTLNLIVAGLFGIFMLFVMLLGALL